MADEVNAILFITSRVRFKVSPDESFNYVA